MGKKGAMRATMHPLQVKEKRMAIRKSMPPLLLLFLLLLLLPISCRRCSLESVSDRATAGVQAPAGTETSLTDLESSASRVP